jgi:hypothetical protein
MMMMDDDEGRMMMKKKERRIQIQFSKNKTAFIRSSFCLFCYLNCLLRIRDHVTSRLQQENSFC